jgi:hypothetical protein
MNPIEPKFSNILVDVDADMYGRLVVTFCGYESFATAIESWSTIINPVIGDEDLTTITFSLQYDPVDILAFFFENEDSDVWEDKVIEGTALRFYSLFDMSPQDAINFLAENTTLNPHVSSWLQIHFNRLQQAGVTEE